MRRWTDLVAALAAIVLAVVIWLVLRDDRVDLWSWVLVAAFAAAPVALYLGLARARANTSDRIALSAVLGADVVLFVLAAPHVDEYVLGGLIFFAVPLYGVLGLLLVLGLLVLWHAVAGRISAARRGPPPSAAAGRP
jgi:hypothetical protein